MGEQKPRVALSYDTDGNVTVYADADVEIISVCDHTPHDRLYRLSPAPIPDGMLDGPIGYSGDGSRSEMIVCAASDALNDGDNILSNPAAVLARLRRNGGGLQ